MDLKLEINRNCKSLLQAHEYVCDDKKAKTHQIPKTWTTISPGFGTFHPRTFHPRTLHPSALHPTYISPHVYFTPRTFHPKFDHNCLWKSFQLTLSSFRFSIGSCSKVWQWKNQSELLWMLWIWLSFARETFNHFCTCNHPPIPHPSNWGTGWKENFNSLIIVLLYHRKISSIGPVDAERKGVQKFTSQKTNNLHKNYLHFKTSEMQYLWENEWYHFEQDRTELYIFFRQVLCTLSTWTCLQEIEFCIAQSFWRLLTNRHRFGWFPAK